MKTDGNLNDIIRDNLRPSGIHFQRIETGAIAAGVPDLNYCADGVEGWIENKKTHGWTVTLRPKQVSWIYRRIRAGGRVMIAVRRMVAGGVRSDRADELWLLRGEYAADLKARGLRWALNSEALLYRGVGGPMRWSWPRIEAELRELRSTPALVVGRRVAGTAVDDL